MSNNSKDTSGPAFPVPLNDGERWTGPGNCCGMTLRDWFAGMAMQGFNANSDEVCLGWDLDTTARLAYEQADAMLERRKGQAGNERRD